MEIHEGNHEYLDGDDFNDIWDEDEASFGDAKNISSDSFVLNKEWERRHNQFHIIGYRDGITAGKEASAQKGFNQGYKESVYAGYSWGLVRGIFSVISNLPEKLKEKVISSLQDKDGFHKLNESTESISSSSALKIFYSSVQRNGHGNSRTVGGDGGDGICNQLDGLFKELNSLLGNSSELSVDLAQIKDSANLA